MNNSEQMKHFQYVRSLPSRELGRGAYGIVFLYIDEKRQRQYVVKEIKLRRQHDINKFKIEAETLYQLSENPDTAPFVSRTKYSLIIENHGYIVQDYEPVGDALDFYNSHMNLSMAVGVSIIDNLIIALQNIHKAGYVHRDIKLENILLRLEGKTILPIPIIIDFGLVCKNPCDDKSLAGTPSYMPENYIPLHMRNSIPRLVSSLKKPVKTIGSVLRPKYSTKTDNYALGIVIQLLIRKIEWTDREIYNKYSEIANRLIHGVISNIAANMSVKIENSKAALHERNEEESLRKTKKVAL